MTKEERKEFYNCSIQDFVKRFNSKNYTDLSEALKDSMKYIARYNLDPRSTKCDIHELLFTAKNEIVNLMAKKNIELNDNDIMVKSFIAKPVEATSYYLEKNDTIFDELEDLPQSDMNYASFLRRNASAISNNIKNPPYPSNYRKLEEKRSNELSIQASLEAQLLDGDDPIKAEFKRQKPNIFEKILRKTSKEYKAFKNGFKLFRDKTSPLYGDDGTLKSLAMDYLKHKFPNLEEGKLPTEDEINSLSGKGKARASLCLKVINVVNEKEKFQEKTHDISTNLKFTIDKFPWEKDEVKTKSLLEEQLEKDIEKENEPLVEESKKTLKDIEVEEYDSKYDQLDVHDSQDIFKS